VVTMVGGNHTIVALGCRIEQSRNRQFRCPQVSPSMRNLLFVSPLVSLLLCCPLASGQNAAAIDSKYKTETDILYRDGGDLDEYAQRRCRLDVYSPTKDSGKPFPTIVWFHGGGSSELIFVSGHSAGGYLTSMVGLDKRWLAAHGIDGKRPIVDDMAPLFHVRPDAPPMLFITGDRNLEMLGRYEENAYMWRMMKVAGHEKSELFELDGFNHSGMGKPAHSLLLNFVRRTPKSP
jgi:hypothetical protein